MMRPSSLEIELKLILPGNQAEELIIDFLRQNNYSIEKISPLKNIDIYMDTSDWSLLKNKLSLRYRLSNGKAMYTMKSVGAIEDGIAKRMENEITLDKPPHAPTEIPVKRLRKQVNEIIYPRKLLEQILIRTNRRRYLAVSPEGTKFELPLTHQLFRGCVIQTPARAATASIRSGSHRGAGYGGRIPGITPLRRISAIFRDYLKNGIPP